MTRSKTQNPLHTTPLISNDDDRQALLDSYVLQHSDAEPDYLYRLWRATNVHMLHGRMASGHLQGRMLKMMVEMIRPRNIIEVGTFAGYSALCMAEGLASVAAHGGEKGHVYTFEINDEQEDFTRPWLEQSPWAEYVSFIIGDAISSAPCLAQEKGIEFDLAFLDGDKRTYCQTYEALLPLMPSGAFILADNTLWDGHVCDATYDRDQQTIGIRRFNDMVAADSRVTRVIIPLRDGLTIIRKN